MRDSSYDYDWVALYKVNFHKAKERCVPFPDMPTLGWGPTPYSAELGLKSLTHHTGKCNKDVEG